MQNEKNYEVVDDEVVEADEVVQNQILKRMNRNQKKFQRKIINKVNRHRQRLRMIKIQKMLFKTKQTETKNPITHLWILRLTPQNDRLTHRNCNRHMNSQNEMK